MDSGGFAHRADAEAVADAIDKLAAEQTDRRLAIWLEVRHGGRRMTDVARRYSCGDGSGAHRVIQRLEARAKKERELAQHLELLAESASRIESCPGVPRWGSCHFYHKMAKVSINSLL